METEMKNMELACKELFERRWLRERWNSPPTNHLEQESLIENPTVKLVPATSSNFFINEIECRKQ